jgi:Kef-type K+ transport system membrane component KefB
LSLIQELGLIFIAATCIGLIGRLIKLPLIITYIFAGFLIGPHVLKLIVDPSQIKALSTIGVVFLLFLVGLELNFSKLKEVGKTALITVTTQIIFIVLISLLIGNYLGYPISVSLFIGLTLIFSSTVIIIKSLGERRDLNSLPGRISVALLLAQDAIAIISLILLNSFWGPNPDLVGNFMRVVLGGMIIVSGSMLAGIYIFPLLFKQLAKSTELLMISAIGWALFAALIVQKLGFSLESGAFIAGVSISSLPYTIEINSKISAIRDFFMAIFFVSLGMTISLAHFNDLKNVWPLVTFIVLGTPFILTLSLLSQGYRSKTALLIALSFTQIGEFSLIFIGLAHNLGRINDQLVSILSLSIIISIILSSFILSNIHALVDYLIPVIRFFERKSKYIPNKKGDEYHDHVVVFGAHHIGQSILKTLKKHPTLKEKIVVVDVNPTIIHHLEEEKYNLIYGDIDDPSIALAANINRALLVISTIPDYKANLAIANKLKKNHRHKTFLYVTARTPHEAIELYENGADYVILPQFLSGEYVSDLIEKFNGRDQLVAHRRKHIHDLEIYLKEGVSV